MCEKTVVGSRDTFQPQAMYSRRYRNCPTKHRLRRSFSANMKNNITANTEAVKMKRNTRWQHGNR
jgi:hypothetical protein